MQHAALTSTITLQASPVRIVRTGVPLADSLMELSLYRPLMLAILSIIKTESAIKLALALSTMTLLNKNVSTVLVVHVGIITVNYKY